MRRPELLAGVGGDADHAHVAVTPGLSGDPLDHVVVIPLVLTVVALRFAYSPELGDHMHIAVGDEAFGIATLDDPVPEGSISRLGRQSFSDFRTL